jgi:hypothetical protein
MTSKTSASSSRHISLEVLSVLRSSDTGVGGAAVWVAAGEFEDADRHLGPRLLVTVGDSIHADGLKDAVRVRLTSQPNLLGVLPHGIARQVESFVAENKDALARHWRGEIDTREMLDLLEKVRP